MDVEASRTLETTGVVVVPMGAHMWTDVRQGFEHYLSTVPEYVAGTYDRLQRNAVPAARRLGAGAAGIVGVASAAHAPVFRLNRAGQTQLVASILQHTVQTSAVQPWLQAIPGNAVFQPMGDKIGQRGPHQMFTRLPPGETFYGSFCNLNLATDQHFDCVVGAAGGQPEPITADVRRAFAANKRSIVVPPGHTVLYREPILIEHPSRRNASDLLRICTGFVVRFTPDMRHPINLPRCLQQAPLTLMDGAVARTVPRLWMCNWVDKWRAFTARFVSPSPLVADHVQRGGAVIGGVCRSVTPSLHALGCMYPAYTAADLHGLCPRRLRMQCTFCKGATDANPLPAYDGPHRWCGTCCTSLMVRVGKHIGSGIKHGPTAPAAGAPRSAFVQWLGHHPWLTATCLDNRLRKEGFIPTCATRGTALELAVYGAFAYPARMVEGVWAGGLLASMLPPR